MSKCDHPVAVEIGNTYQCDFCGEVWTEHRVDQRDPDAELSRDFIDVFGRPLTIWFRREVITEVQP